MQGNEEDQVCAWVKELTGQDVEPGTMKDTLKSGVILCELVSRIALTPNPESLVLSELVSLIALEILRRPVCVYVCVCLRTCVNFLVLEHVRTHALPPGGRGGVSPALPRG
jgi:hypothetical protein